MAARELTPTSYAILGLLALRPWTTYELAQQAKRSLSNFWPRAERRLYDEPKVLVAHGLARARAERTGRRPRTVYSITSKGRAALRRWLDEPAGGGVQLESEALLKVFLADQGSKEALLRTVRAVREEAESETRRGIAFMREYRSTGGPFPERLHVISVMVRFLGLEHGLAVLRWARWAEREIMRWPDTRNARANRKVFEEVLRASEEALGDRPPREGLG